MDIAAAPVFHSLNKPQKRALMMRDSLRFLEPRHLDTFIHGIVDDEPPSYQRINGVIQPPLIMVTLKDTATRFDLGNVHFMSEQDPANNRTRRAYLTVEDGRFELRTEEALPADEANLDSVPIHLFIAKTMVPLFEAKFKAVYTRMKRINEIRQVTFNMTGQQAPHFEEGEVSNIQTRILTAVHAADVHRRSRDWTPRIVQRMELRLSVSLKTLRVPPRSTFMCPISALRMPPHHIVTVLTNIPAHSEAAQEAQTRRPCPQALDQQAQARRFGHHP
jgi:hypothetical protein